MNILALDSSSQNISIGLLYEGRVLFDFNRKLSFGASKLVSFIDTNLKKYRINPEEIDVFALGSGPGSFTGLRASFSIIKAFMLALKKPAVCIESFYSIAHPLAKEYNKIAVISDAKRGLIYAAPFTAKGGLLKKEAKTALISLKDFAKEHAEYFFVTYDEHLYGQLTEASPGIKFSKTAVFPKAKYYLEIAKSLAEKGKFTDIGNLEPLYLHPKTCQIR
ncbi:MAG: tRNA (adenosine(37)-N6)-threonylcarbamoyltransferase complex dimerization subunit type 1 TsaB [Candidatus Omnitrophica bacterium]|nr:tRNA (adenosine(37)-N6)-threonylcarbamoyltransferase complex dimerization subunit type 1 TsaB [Candidatus Omnitrophota bacterium]